MIVAIVQAKRDKEKKPWMCKTCFQMVNHDSRNSVKDTGLINAILLVLLKISIYVIDDKLCLFSNFSLISITLNRVYQEHYYILFKPGRVLFFYHPGEIHVQYPRLLRLWAHMLILLYKAELSTNHTRNNSAYNSTSTSMVAFKNRI